MNNSIGFALDGNCGVSRCGLLSKCSLENIFKDFDLRDLQHQHLGVTVFLLLLVLKLCGIGFVMFSCEHLSQ